MGYYWMTAGAMFLFLVALVSVRASVQAYWDGRSRARSRQNWTAMTLWALVASLTLASGISVAWVTDRYFSGPSAPW